MRLKKICGVFTCIAVCLLFLSSGSDAQGQKAVIKEVRVDGNRAVSEATILSKIKTRPGDAFSQDILNDDLKRLYAMGYFTDVSIDVQGEEEGLIIVILVEEKPIVEDVVITGNSKISTSKLKQGMQIKTG
ncbi:MAG: POTRA domain-containing protein, partial [Candidatus Omnitrophota bacterium]